MSGFREEFKFIFDVVGNKQATKAFADVGKAADKAGAQTEAGVGKAAKSFGSFAKNAAPIAGALAAAGAAAFAAANKFEKLALSAGKLANSTGMTTEAASRWIEVAGDMGIETSVLESALAKMDKALATTPAKFEELGVAIAHAKDGTVDVSGTFLNAIDTINGIQNPLQRSKVAAELFGKGWTSMSELINTGAGSLRASLAAVDASKVVTPDKLGKAKDYREAMDHLHDSMENLSLVVGEALVPVLEGVAGVLADIVGLAGPAAAGIAGIAKGMSGDPKASGWWRSVAGALTLGGTELRRWYDYQKANSGPGGGGNYFLDNMYDLPAATTNAALGIGEVADALKDQFGKAIDESTTYVKRGTIAQDDLNYTMRVTAEETRKAAAATRILNDQWEALFGQFDRESTSNRITETAKELAKAAKSGKLSPDQVVSFKSDSASAFRNVGVSERTFRVTILPAIDRGEYDRVAALLDALTKFRVAPFEPRLTTTKLGDKTAYATGGNIGTKGGIVGDAGPEYFQPASAGRIFTSGELARAVSGGGSSSGGNTYQIAVTVDAGANPAEVGRQTVEAIKQYERMAGSGWRN